MIYAIGDIHAQHALLSNLLAQIAHVPLGPEDTILFLGDYIDRGNEAQQVLDTLIALRDGHPRTVFLRGNHEQMILDAYERAQERGSVTADFEGPLPLSVDERLWLSQGGAETLLSYRPDLDKIDNQEYMQWHKFLPETHWDFLRATQIEFIEGSYHFVHAGLLPADCNSWEYQRMGSDPRLWIREPFLSSSSDFGGRVVVFGHTPQIDSKRPLIEANKLGLDTGAGFGGPLTAAVMDPSNPVRGHVHQIYQSHP